MACPMYTEVSKAAVCTTLCMFSAALHLLMGILSPLVGENLVQVSH